MKFRFGNGDKPLDGFTIKRGVGIGGFGEVYFAVNDAGKEVALKQIQRNLDVEVRGVRQCMNLKHPNLIGLYDIRFDADNQGWIVMEYVSGASLQDVLEANPDGVPMEELKRWFGQIATGVTYLHDHGIVHRDLKPGNIFEDSGIVKIGDYGLSKFISCSRRGGQTESVGTFHYMAPEIGKGEYGKEIDIYALGVMLYELATGMVPFSGESSQEIIMKHLTADPDLSALQSPIREVVDRALQKNPANRFSDVRDMVRPLGMEVDDRYLLVDTGRVAQSNLPPVINPIEEPVAQIEPPRAAEYVRQPNPAPKPKRPTPTREPESAVYYREPIARNLRQGWLGVNRWWAELSMNSGMKTALLIVLIVFCALNAGTIVSLLVAGLCFYVPYYAIWWLVSGGANQPKKNAPTQTVVNRVQQQPLPVAKPAHRQPRNQKPVSKPMGIQQWRVARRAQLAQAKRSSVWTEVTGSWLGAAAVIAVFSSLVALFKVGAGGEVQPMLIGMVWAALVALLSAWVAIGLGKRWQKEEGDWAIRSFVQLTFGFLVGGFAFLLSDFLMVPWSAIAGESMTDVATQDWKGFFAGRANPLMPAYLAYFPLLMGSIQWWKQVDPLRRVRFSFWAVIWSVIVATLLHMILPFPQPWGALVAAGTSIAVQLASPWINSNERLQMRVSENVAA